MVDQEDTPSGKRGAACPIPDDELRQILSDLKTVRERLEGALTQEGPSRGPGEGPIPSARRTVFGGLRSKLPPSSPGWFTQGFKLSQAGPAGRRGLNVATAYLSQFVLFAAIGLSAFLALATLTSKLTGWSPFPGIVDAERAMVAILTGLFAVTLAALLSESRLFRSLRDESVSILQLNEMDEHYAQLAREGIANYASIVKNLQHNPRLKSAVASGAYYRRIAAVELNKHRALLQALAKGTYSAHEAHIDGMLDSMLDSVTTYAAVSHRDNEYWSDDKPDRIKYRSRLGSVSRQGKVMRIFIAQMSDLRDDWDNFLKILDTQDGTQVRWGLAIEDRFDRSIAALWKSDIVPNLPLVRSETFDFALVNGGEVATFFTHDYRGGERHLLATFNVPPREREILACGSMFIRLLSEVWIGSASLAADWRRFVPGIMESRLRKEIGIKGTPEKFVRRQDSRWKESRLKLFENEKRCELVRLMGLDPKMVVDHTRERRTSPFEVIRSTNDLADDMKLFRQILKADVFATGYLDEVDALCDQDEARRYREIARELGLHPTRRASA
jgi:hypothetical protein